MDDMVQDIGDVMNWVQQNISEYGGDKVNVYYLHIMVHSMAPNCMLST